MRVVPLLVAALAAAAAVAAAVLAHAVVAAETAVAEGDATFVTGGRADWEAGTPAAGTARRLLGLEDDLEMRAALAAYRRAAAGGSGLGGGLERQGVRSAAEAALAEVAQDEAGARSAQASVLLGTLLFSDPAAGGAPGASPAERAHAAFANGLDAQPGYEPAAYDLELLLRLLEARGERPGANAGAGPRGGGRRGAGGGTPGRGY